MTCLIYLDTSEPRIIDFERDFGRSITDALTLKVFPMRISLLSLAMVAAPSSLVPAAVHR
jgi:hypothetical protein